MTTWQQPLAGTPRVTSPYGPRTAPRTSGGTGSTNHLGVDYAAPSGTPVRAIAAGTVTSSGVFPGAGETIKIAHSDGTASRYLHLSRRDVKAGQAVKAGQVIGTAGSTGNVSAAHLHLEVHIDGKPVDPVPFLAARVGKTTTKPATKPTVTVLREGSTGAEVKKLQRALNAVLPRTRGRHPLVVDGIYGWRTEAHVRDAQALLGIKVDGVAGKITQAALRM